MKLQMDLSTSYIITQNCLRRRRHGASRRNVESGKAIYCSDSSAIHLCRNGHHFQVGSQPRTQPARFSRLPLHHCYHCRRSVRFHLREESETQDDLVHFWEGCVTGTIGVRIYHLLPPSLFRHYNVF